MERDFIMQLEELLTPETIRLQVHVTDPMNAVQEAGALLVASGGVEERYIQAMQQSLLTNGPYMVIVPGVALLHARPEDGVKQLCMSLLTLDPPLAFGNEDNDPVDLAFAFGAVDHQKHVDALAALARLLADEQALVAIRSSTSIEAVLNVIAAVPTKASSL
jgi:mannitol/fructose-specific phosphotransferase system IIA component (Ntr-type)